MLILILLLVNLACLMIIVIGTAIYNCVDYIRDCKKYGKEFADELQSLYKRKGI